MFEKRGIDFSNIDISKLDLRRLKDIEWTPKKIGILVTVGLVLIGTIIGVSLNKSYQESKYVVEISIKDSEKVIELKNNGDKYSKVFVDGKEIELHNKVISKGKAMLLPDVSNSIDIEKEKKISTLTYESDLKKSASYVNYLKSKGYVTVREVRTPEYIEYFMTLDGKGKRLIIYNNIIMVGNLKDKYSLPKLDVYFE